MLTPNFGTGGGQHLARRGFRALAWIFAGGILAQTFLAGLSLFVDARRWMLHVWLGTALVLPIVGMLLLGFLGRLDRGTRRLTAAALGLLLVQGGSAAVGGIAGAFHPANAVLLFWIAVVLIGRSQRESATVSVPR